MGKPWTAQEDATVIRMTREGSEIIDIATALGRTRYAVHARKRALDLTPTRVCEHPDRARIIRTYRELGSIAATARELGYGVNTISIVLHSEGLDTSAPVRLKRVRERKVRDYVWTHEEDAKLIALLCDPDSGCVEEVAQQVGRSRCATARRMWRQGWGLRKLRAAPPADALRDAIESWGVEGAMEEWEVPDGAIRAWCKRRGVAVP